MAFSPVVAVFSALKRLMALSFLRRRLCRLACPFAVARRVAVLSLLRDGGRRAGRLSSGGVSA
ncbi:hypothetical protein GCM10009099_39790 [Caenispirillum bisanense]